MLKLLALITLTVICFERVCEVMAPHGLTGNDQAGRESISPGETGSGPEAGHGPERGREDLASRG